MYKKNWAMGGDERPFNMAALLLQRLDKRMDEANNASVEGDSFRWYKVLRTIYTAISFKLSEEEKKKIDGMLGAIRGKILTAIRNKEEVLFFDVEAQLTELDHYLVELAFKYGLYYPKYSTEKWQDKLEKEDL